MEKTFEEKLSIFDEYISKYNFYPQVKEEYKDFKIGNWINNIRMIYNHGVKQDNNDIVFNTNRLTEEQIKVLEEHNFYFSNFDIYLNLLKEFININKRYPLFNEMYNDKNIGAWVIKNRVIFKNGKKDENGNIYYKTFKLTQKQIDKLNEINFIWERKIENNTWQENYNLLLDFIKEHNRLPKHSEIYKNKNIGAWICNQKINFNKGIEIEKDVFRYKHNSSTTKEQFYKLNDLGIEFVKEKNRYYNATIKTKEDLLFKKRYLLLQLHNMIKDENINEISSKKDIENINKLYLKRLSN